MCRAQVYLQTTGIQGGHVASSYWHALIFLHIGWSLCSGQYILMYCYSAGHGPKGIFILKGPSLKTLVSHSLFKTSLLVGRGGVAAC